MNKVIARATKEGILRGYKKFGAIFHYWRVFTSVSNKPRSIEAVGKEQQYINNTRIYINKYNNEWVDVDNVDQCFDMEHILLYDKVK
jgi:hypothetical protein